MNISDNTYESFYPELDDESYHNLMDGQDGFEKVDWRTTFCCRESDFFPMEDFLENFGGGKYSNLRQRQLDSLSDLAVNLDGTCGQKVHDFMIGALEKKYNITLIRET